MLILKNRQPCFQELKIHLTSTRCESTPERNCLKCIIFSLHPCFNGIIRSILSLNLNVLFGLTSNSKHVYFRLTGNSSAFQMLVLQKQIICLSTCVVLPEPVSPTSTKDWFFIRISVNLSLYSQTGSCRRFLRIS